MRAIRGFLLRPLLLFDRRFLLSCLNFRLMLGSVALLRFEARRFVVAIACVLHTARGGVVKLLLVIRLLPIEGRLILSALRCFGLALRFRNRVLTLLLSERFRACLFRRRTLWRVGIVLCAFDRRLLVTLLRVLQALFVVERELFLADLLAYIAFRRARGVEAMIDEKVAVTIVLLERIPIVIFLATHVQLLLTCAEAVRVSVR